MNAEPLHVVFGGGQIGAPLARALAARGCKVRMVRRAGRAPDGVELRLGDAGDADFATEATKGAAAVYHCMNPPYLAAVWARELPRLMESLLTAAARNRARLVQLDNLYMLGSPAGQKLSEALPSAPLSRKGEIRARVAERMFDAHRRGDARCVAGRASDFYGPGATQSFFGDYFWPKALAEGKAQVITPVDELHTWHYSLDVAEALANLGMAEDDVTGRWWILPCDEPATPREMVTRFARAIGRDLKLEIMPGWLLGALGLFVPMLREMGEMKHQWARPFVCDDTQFRQRFGGAATRLQDGVPAAVAWAREHYSAAMKK